MVLQRLAIPLRRFLFASLIILLLLLITAARGTADTPGAAPPTTTATTITKDDETGFSFELFVAAAEIDMQGDVVVPGLDLSIVQPGAPNLPYFSTYVAIPPQATFDVNIREFNALERPDVSIAPSPTYSFESVQESADGIFIEGDGYYAESDPSFTPDADIYGSNSYFPEERYIVNDEVFAGGLRLIKLDIYPLRYNAVRKVLEQTSYFAVQVEFGNAVLKNSSLDRDPITVNPIWRDRVLNDPPSGWLSQASPTVEAAQVNLPFGVKTYKIEVDQDGIYAIKGSELGIKAGDNIAPSSIQMMHRGKAVAYQFVNNDADSSFGPSDEVRFFGWEFDGTRYEDLFVSENIFWLWFAGSGEQITTENNDAGKGFTPVDTFNESINKWPHLYYFPGWRIKWDQTADNDPTAYYWKYYFIDQGKVVNSKLDIELPDPVVSSGATGTVLVEFSSTYGSRGGGSVQYKSKVSLNDAATSTNKSWENGDNVNVVHKAPMSQFKNSQNEIALELSVDKGDTSPYGGIYVTRATVDYLRHLIAVGDQLIFDRETKDKSEFLVTGFSGSVDSAQALVWDISDKYKPIAIKMNASNIKPAGAMSTYHVGRDHQANARFIASTTDSLKNVNKISEYVPKKLTPPDKAGTWVAITHNSFLPAADWLAQHRANQPGNTPWNSGMSTVVLDIEDVVNQAGFGFRTPSAVRDFLRYAVTNWDEPPQFVTLFGDATLNPRNITCSGCGDATRPTFVPTDLVFVDRFIGMIPSDFTYSLLVGDDLIPDVAVARIPAETLAEANAMVNKIILYENKFSSKRPEETPWLDMPLLFVADDPDTGGNFCAESLKTATHSASVIDKEFLCLPSDDELEDSGTTKEKATKDLRDDLFDLINSGKLSIVNYRGHGSVHRWAHPTIIDTTMVNRWENVDKPIVILSADCLDGHFAQTNVSGLGEVIMKLSRTGSAAHWASVGYGYTFEHSHLHSRFYDAVFNAGLFTVGEAVNFAKTSYVESGYDESEAYGFVLLGDAAMSIFPWQPTINMPVVMRP